MYCFYSEVVVSTRRLLFLLGGCFYSEVVSLGVFIGGYKHYVPNLSSLPSATGFLETVSKKNN